MKWIYLLLSIFSEVIATSALNESQGFSRLTPSLITVIGYASTFLFLSFTLKELNLSIAYAIWSGVGTVCLTLIAYFRYNQKIDGASVLGIAFIVLGVVIIHLFSRTVSH